MAEREGFVRLRGFAATARSHRVSGASPPKLAHGSNASEGGWLAQPELYDMELGKEVRLRPCGATARQLRT